MSTCTCRHCGPRGTTTTTVEVTITLTLLRDGWYDHGPDQIWGEREEEHELRAAVTYRGVNDEPEVEWLDKAVLEDLDLDASELEGAEEQAAEAGYSKLMARGPAEDPRDALGDYLYEQSREAV